MLIETERLKIRRIEENDWKSIKEIWSDFSVSAYAQYDRPNSTKDDEVRERIKKWADANHGMEHMFFAICLEKKMIGYASFHSRKEGYEIGYCFHSAYHGKGYAKESLTALFSYLKEKGITSFMAGTALKNLPSVYLLTSLGFKKVAEEKVSFYQDADGNDIFFDGGIFLRNGD